MILLKGEEKFPFHPDRANRTWRESDHKPVTPLQGSADFVMPFLSANDIGPTIPCGNAVAPKHFRQAIGDVPISRRMGQEDLFG